MANEDFVVFSEVTNATGLGLATSILKQLGDLGLDLSKLRGKGYDRCSSMSGRENGVQAHEARKWPKAIYSHCASHRLNLVLVRSSEEQAVRNTLSTAQSCAVFFSNSSK